MDNFRSKLGDVFEGVVGTLLITSKWKTGWKKQKLKEREFWMNEEFKNFIRQNYTLVIRRERT